MTISESTNTQTADSNPVLEQRHWPLEGAFNVRDVGGYPTADGHQTRWRTLWRADSLHQLSAADQHTLLDAGLHTVIDLRYAQEVKRSPDVFASALGTAYHNVELLPGAPSTGTLPMTQPPASLSDVYRMLIDYCQPSIRQVIEIAADENSGPLLVHCTLGKDRTGVITALLLSTVGVADELVVEDYALTSQYVQTLLPALREQARQDGRDMVRYEAMLACKPQAMADLLAYIHKQYGGAANYLRGIGISNEQIAHLHAWLTM